MIFASWQANAEPKSLSYSFAHKARTHDFPGESAITKLYQASSGMLWLASAPGLFSYNGNRFDFVARLPGVNDIVEDSSGMLWIATNTHLVLFNPFTLSVIKEIKVCGEINCEVTALHISGDELWIGTKKGVAKIILRGSHAITYFEDTKTHFITDIKEGKNGTIWFASRLHSLLIKSKSIAAIDFFKDSNGEYFRDNARSLLVVDSGLFVAGSNGLAMIDNTNTVNYFKLKGFSSVINAMAQLNESTLLLGTRDQGLWTFDINTKAVANYSLLDNKSVHLPTKKINDILIDQFNDILIATDRLISISFIEQQITNYLFNEENYNVYTVYQAKDRAIWLGTWTAGAIRLGADQQYTIYDRGRKPFSAFQDNRVLAFFEDQHSRLHLAFALGIGVIDTDTHLPREFAMRNRRYGNIYSFNESQDNRRWFTQYGSFGYIDTNGVYKTFRSHDMNGISFLGALASNDNLFLNSDQGIYLFDTTQEKLLKVNLTVNKQIINPEVVRLEEYVLAGEKGYLICTDDGRLLFATVKNEINWQAKVLLSVDSAVYRYLELVSSRWLLSKHALYKLNEDWSIQAMVRTGDFNPRTHYDVSSGNWYMGTHKGVFKFKPSAIQLPEPRLEVFVAQLQYDNADSERPVNVNIDRVNRNKLISLPRDYETMNIAFSTFDFAEKNPPLMYRWEQSINWRALDSNQSLSIPRLRHGDYRLSVAHAERLSKSLDLRIVIPTPWWASYWAYSIYLIVFTCFIIGFYSIYSRFKNRQIVMRNVELEHAVANRTKELLDKNYTIEQQSKKLSHLLKLKDELFIDLTHELKTPISLMMASTELIKENAKDNYIVDLTRLAGVNGTRLLRTIKQLLDFEKFSYADNRNLQAFDLVAACQGYLSSFRQLFEQKNIKLIVDFPLHLNIDCEPQALEKMVINLLSNALKYTPSGGAVSLRIAENTPMACLLVHNTGSFIGANEQKSIFEKFNRLPEHKNVAGTGVGLSLVKKLAELYGGSVALESDPHDGTSFSLNLLLAKNQQRIENESSLLEETNAEVTSLLEVLPESSGSVNDEAIKKCILLVEDNEELANCIKIGLEQDYHIEIAGNGIQGVAKAKALVPDLIISDLMMPELDGFELCHQLKSALETMHIPIIILTAKSGYETRMTAWQLLADEFIEKPFEWNSLRSRIKTLIQTRNHVQRKLYFDYVTVSSDAELSQSDADNDEQLARIRKTIEENFSRQDFGPDQLAEYIGMSRRSLDRHAKDLFGTTPLEFIRAFRLNKARELLKNGETITRVIDQVGIKSNSQFSRWFKEKYQMTPSEFRAQHFR